MNEQPDNPLHGITLEMILNSLVERFGWEELGKRIPIRCFTNDPSIKSSLKFLRRTPWARKKVEDLYLASGKEQPWEIRVSSLQVRQAALAMDWQRHSCSSTARWRDPRAESTARTVGQLALK